MRMNPAIYAAMAMIAILIGAVFYVGGYYCGLFTLLALGLLYAIMYSLRVAAGTRGDREFVRNMRQVMGPPHYKHWCPYD